MREAGKVAAGMGLQSLNNLRLSLRPGAGEWGVGGKGGEKGGGEGRGEGGGNGHVLLLSY